MINLNAKKMISIIKIIILDTKIFAKKLTIAFIFEINGSNIYIIIAFIN